MDDTNILWAWSVLFQKFYQQTFELYRPTKQNMTRLRETFLKLK